MMVRFTAKILLRWVIALGYTPDQWVKREMFDDTASWKRRSETDDGSPPTLFDVLVSAFGYFLVAVLCSLAGYALGHKTSVPRVLPEWLPLIILWALLAPAYVGRAALYECTKTKFITRDDRTAIKWQKKISWQYGLAAFLVALLLTGSPLVGLGRDNPVLLAQIACTTAPMYVLGIYLGIRWPRDPRLFDFRYRNFFPALATCLPPFVFGYEVGGDLVCSVVATLLVIVPWLIALFTPARRFAVGGFIVLVLLVLALPLQSGLTTSALTRCVVLSTFGLLLTLAMGVCETWRFTARVLNDVEYRPDGQFSSDIKRYYLGGANLATALFLPIFLWTALHPATTRVYVIFAFALLAIQYAVWFLDRTETKQTWWPDLGAVIGYLYPVVVAVGTSLSQWPVSEKAAAAPSLFDMLTAWAFLAVPAIPLVRYSGLWELWSERERLLRFRSFALCAGTTGMVALILAASAVGSMFVLGQFFDPPPFAVLERATFLVFVYVVIAVICTVAVLAGRLRRPQRAAVRTNDDGDPTAGSALQYAGLIFISGRPLSAAIAASIPAIVAACSGSGLLRALSAGAALFFATLLGFVINDIFDYEKDRAGRRPRPIATGRLPKLAAWIGVVVLAVAAVASGHMARGSDAISLLLLALVFYTPFARAYPLLKGIYTAGLCVLPVLFAATISATSVSLLLIASLAVFVVGRELLLDVQDRASDQRWGLRTLAVVMGARRASAAGITLMFSGAVMATWFAATPVGRLFAAVATISVAMIFAVRNVPLHRRLQLSRFSMACGALAVAFSMAV